MFSPESDSGPDSGSEADDNLQVGRLLLSPSRLLLSHLPPASPASPDALPFKLHRAVVPRLLPIKGHSLIVQLGLVIPAIKSSRWYRSPTQAIRTHLPSCRCREARRAVCGDDSLAARPPGYGGVNHTRDLILSSSLLSYFQLRGDGVFRIRLGEPGCVWFT